MTDKTLDFDAFWEEKKGKPEPKKITIQGEEYNLPPEFPAETGIMFLKLREEKSNEDMVFVDEISEVYKTLFGEKQTKKLLSSGIGLSKLFGLMGYIRDKVYKIDNPKSGEEEAGKGETEQPPGKKSK